MNTPVPSFTEPSLHSPIDLHRRSNPSAFDRRPQTPPGSAVAMGDPLISVKCRQTCCQSSENSDVLVAAFSTAISVLELLVPDNMAISPFFGCR